MVSERDSKSLRGKTILVTGGGNGIGRAVVSIAADEGADVAIFDIDAPRSFVGFSLGAILGIRFVVEHAKTYPRVVFVEGGYKRCSPSWMVKIGFMARALPRAPA